LLLEKEKLCDFDGLFGGCAGASGAGSGLMAALETQDNRGKAVHSDQVRKRGNSTYNGDEIQGSVLAQIEHLNFYHQNQPFPTNKVTNAAGNTQSLVYHHYQLGKPGHYSSAGPGLVPQYHR
jgi:hypothetical protein